VWNEIIGDRFGVHPGILLEGLWKTLGSLKNTVFSDVTLYGSCKKQHFGGTLRSGLSVAR
jgi:hypothetical protein